MRDDMCGQYIRKPDEEFGTSPGVSIAREKFFSALRNSCPEVFESLRNSLLEPYKEIIIGLYGRNPIARMDLEKLDLIKPNSHYGEARGRFFCFL